MELSLPFESAFTFYPSEQVYKFNIIGDTLESGGKIGLSLLKNYQIVFDKDSSVVSFFEKDTKVVDKSLIRSKKYVFIIEGIFQFIDLILISNIICLMFFVLHVEKSLNE